MVAVNSNYDDDGVINADNKSKFALLAFFCSDWLFHSMDLLSHCSFPLFSTFNAAAKYQANPHKDLSQSKLEFAAFKSEMRAEVKKEVDNGLRDLPSEMVCAYQRYLTSTKLRPNHRRV